MIIIKKLKLYTIIGVFFVILVGTFSHFAYEWSGNNYFVGFLSPINESTWEHMKLLFFPMLFYSIIMNYKLKEKYPCIESALSFGILLGTFLIPIIFYTYTGIIGKNIFILDLLTFIISVIFSFYIVNTFTLSCKMQKHIILLNSLLFILILCFLIFTYRSPDIGLFADPSN